MHDIGNTGTFFDRIDLEPSGKDALHLDLMAARNWMQIPNTYDQPRQDQRQRVLSFDIAPAYQHTIDSKTLVSINAFVRRDQATYYPSRNPLDDSPATLAQDRSLSNFGVHSDLAHIQGRNNWKAGLNATRTRLDEEFSLGITDPAYNSPYVSGGATGLQPNPAFLSSLLPYDLTRGGRLYQFRGKADINQLAVFGQDSVTLGELTLNFGLRFDRYNGLTDGNGVQPRGAFSYLFKPRRLPPHHGNAHE